ncbi:hypothetical protein A2U01_0056500, partial [Trifolium medium]|nr:hypothetical protein [Trifolium medium]
FQNKLKNLKLKRLLLKPPKSDETLDESRHFDESVADVTVQSSVLVNVQMGMSRKISTGPVAESVKENTITPDAAQNVGASSVQPNPNPATITESFG